MAKKLVYTYTFDASAQTITFDGNWTLRTLILITNVTDNVIIYNFADPSAGGSVSYDTVNEQTTVTLTYNTTSMSDSDELQILVDEQEVKIDASESLLDPVNKFRVSNPENLIDTDFEYGLQSTKWETVELVDNVPSVYTRASGITIGGINQVNTVSNSDVVTVVTTIEHGLSTGDPIEIQGTTSRTANGKYLVTTVIDDYTFSYISSAVQSSTLNIRTSYTTIIPGSFFVGSEIKILESEGIITDGGSPSTLTAYTEYKHGLSNGTSLYVTNTIGKEQYTVSNTTATAPDGATYVDAADEDIYISPHNLTEGQTITISPNTTSNPSAVLPTLSTGAPDPLGSTTINNVYASVNTAVDSIRSTIAAAGHSSRIYLNNSGNYTYYNTGGISQILTEDSGGSLQYQDLQYGLHQQGNSSSEYRYYLLDSSGYYRQWHWFVLNSSIPTAADVFTGNPYNLGQHFIHRNGNSPINPYPSNMIDRIYYQATPHNHNSYTNSLVEVWQFDDPAALNAGWTNGSQLQNGFGYAYQRNLNANRRFTTNWSSNNTYTSVGNGWEYSWSGVWNPPLFNSSWGGSFGNWGGWICMEIALKNTNFSGYRPGNAFWSNNSYNNVATFASNNYTYHGTGYRIRVLLQTNTSAGNTAYGLNGTTLTFAQIASAIATQVANDNSYGSWANGTSSANTVLVSSATTSRISLKTTANQPLKFSTTGTGPLNIETQSISGVLDNYFSVTGVGSTYINFTSNGVIPNREISFASADVSLTNITWYINVPDGHGLLNGQRLVYNVVSGSGLGGILNGYTYYAIVVDDKNLTLAISYEAANNGQSSITSAGSGTFRLNIPSISGRAAAKGTVTTTSSSNIVTGDNTKFLTSYKVGDSFTLLSEPTGSSLRNYSTNIVSSVVSDTSLTLNSPAGITTSSANHFTDTKINVRADGTFLHRPFDGGVEITAGKSPDSQIVRQTRKYFRYQSGKGIQCSMAINFSPYRPARTVSGSGTNITITTEYPHGLTTGDYVIVSGAEERNSYTPTNALYNASTGDLTITVNSHGFLAGEYVKLAENSITFTCDLDSNATNHAYPRSSDPAGGGELLLIKSVTTNTFVVNVGTSSYAGNHTFVSAATDAVTHIDTSNAYNGEYVVTSYTDFTFSYTSSTSVSVSNPKGFVEYAIRDYTNAGIRAGLFDFQNGFFFEYNGKNLYAVRRSSVQQIPGSVNATYKSNILTGIDTRFQDNLEEGDMIVLRGQSYKITSVESNTELHIQPYYKGEQTTSAVITKTVDTRIPQSQWNIDKADGSGPSGYNLDIHKIQMVYLDYSWYGAGKIRFGFKDTKGHVKYVHEFIHNNRLNEAYMRSGNIPARYEAYNEGTPTYVPSLFHWGTSVIMDGGFDDDDSYLFTAAGNTLTFTNGDSDTATTSGASALTYRRLSGGLRDYVQIPFSTADASKFTVGIPLYTSGGQLNGETVSFTDFSGGAFNVYIYVGQYYFNSPPAIYPSVSSGTSVSIGAPASGGESEVDLNDLIPLISIRLAPAVDNNVTGRVGTRDIINRMQLQLKELGISVSHDTKITVILNGSLDNLDYENVGSPSLSEYIAHDIGDQISGGTTIYSFRASGGSTDSTGKRLSVSSAFNLDGLSDLGNSILGGDDVFPNGPDIITICATVIDTSEVDSGSSYRVASRLSWAESQA